jgi:Cu(I)/Ag(I) efflux system protein CusF
MLNTRIAAAVLGAAFLLTGLASAQPAPAEPTAMADGEVRKVDKEARKLTIRHGPLPALDMPPMTMVFGVQDAAMLEQVQVGEKVRFVAEKIEGRFVVTRIEAGKP